MSQLVNHPFVKYIFRGLLFSIPFIIYFLVILIVDPHCFANVFHVIKNEDKAAIIDRNDESTPRGNILYKTLRIKREKPKKILIGDSQGTHINMKLVEDYCGEKVFNYCVPGASFETLFKMFWVAAEEAKPQKIYFQVAFMNYNSKRSYDIFNFAQDYIDKPYLYYLTKENFKDSFVNIWYQITKNPKIIERSYLNMPDEEINLVAESRLKMFFDNYIYPKDYFSELNKISTYCKENNIELEFLILPVYRSVDDYLEKTALTDMKKRFKDDIRFLGNTYDLDVPGEIKNTRAYFIDYFHMRQPQLDIVTKQIWCRK
jgi:hypothetical protein